MTYRDATALVTGASTALGREFCRQLAGRYSRVIAVADNAGELADLAEEVHPLSELYPLAADLTTVEGLTRVTEAVRQRGPVEVLVNHADGADDGIFGRAQIDDQLARTRLRVEAPLTLCRAVIPFMREAGLGAIVNVADIGGFRPQAGSAVSSAAGAFLYSLSLALSEELSPDRIRVQALCLGDTTAAPVASEPGVNSAPGGRTSPHEPSFADLVGASLDALDTGGVLVIPGRAQRQIARDGVERLRRLLPRD